jgi:hypothetical protein
MSTYTPGTLTQTTYYRLKQTSASSCGSVYTNIVTITVYGNLTAGTVSSSQSICYNTAPAPLTSVDPTGGNTPYIYQWQSSADNTTYGDVSGATQSNYSPGALTQTTWYRLKQVSANNCGFRFTAGLAITVEPTPVSGTLTKTPDQAEVCIGDVVSANFTAGTGGNGIDSTWYRIKTGDTWSVWSLYSGGTNVATNGKSVVEIKTRRYADFCPHAAPNVVSWIVSPTTVAGAVSGGVQVCYGSNSTLLTLSGHTGTVTKWQYSVNNSTWNDTTITTPNFTAVNITVPTWFRAVVQSGVCNTLYSASTQITVFANYHISGSVRYENNPKTPLNGLKITLKKDDLFQASINTNPSGFYDFGGLVNGNDSLEVSSAHPSGQWQTWGGVNNTDALIVLNHINNVTPLVVNPPVVRITADVKSPHPVIGTNDYLALRQAAKAPTTGYNYFDIPKWVFSGTSVATGLDNITLDCGDVTRDISGLCAGDVNGSYTPVSGNKVSDIIPVPSLSLIHQGAIPLSGAMVFPVKATSDMVLGAITLMLRYDPALVEITGVSMPWLNETEPWFDPDNGLLMTGWSSQEPIRIPQNGTIMLISARAISKADHTGTHPSIRFTLDNNPLSELADGAGNIHADAVLSVPDAGGTSSGQAGNRGLDGVVIYPNPAYERLTVEYILERPGDVTYEICNIHGGWFFMLKRRNSPVAGTWICWM